MIYNKNQEVFQIKNAIIGFQPINNHKDKCLVWFKQIVTREDKPTFVNSKYPTKPTWSKVIWSISDLFLHFESALSTCGISRAKMEELSLDTCSKWQTTDGEYRNFIKCILPNPLSELVGKSLNIRIVRYLGVTPKGVIKRARLEASTPEDFDVLLNKYRDKARVMTYNQLKALIPVYGYNNGRKVVIYEEKEQVWGKPKHVLETTTLDKRMRGYKEEEIETKLKLGIKAELLP